jgi:ligand-binding SRPBCC domain-containing protein
MGLAMTWRTLIAEYEPPHYFVDEQERGPYRFWRHRHTFERMDRGALVADEVVYALPLGALGGLAHRLAVGRQLREIFAYRQRALGGILGGAVAVGEPVTS